MAGGTITSPLSEWLLVALIIFSLIFELILHRLEHWVHHHHHHLFAALRVLYRELMILGIISFSFIIYELTGKREKSTILSFEFAHLFIFALAIFYTAIILSAMFLSLRLSARWKQMERMDLVQYLNLRDKYSQVSAIVERRGHILWRSFWWFPNLVKLYNYTRLHEVMTFHDIRFQFIYYRNLPDNFRFSSFLRKIKATTFIDLVESHWSLWIIFLFAVLADIARRTITDDPVKIESEKVTQAVGAVATALSSTVHANEYGKGVTNADPTLFDNIVIICAAVVLGAFSQVLAWKSRRIYWKLTSHPRMYYEGVEAEAVMQELQKLADDRDNTRRRRDISRSVASGEDASDIGNEADQDDEEDLIMRGRMSEAFAENEMLDPMRPQPLRSPLHPSTSATAAAAAAAAAARAQNGNTSDGASRPVSVDLSERSMPNYNGMTDSKPSDAVTTADSTLVEMGYRHSLQNRSTTDLSQLSSQFAQKEQLENASDADDIVRHSMEVPRSVNDELAPTTSTSKSAYIARAAVEMARKKSNLDGETSDHMFIEEHGSLPGLGSPRLMSRTSSTNLLSAAADDAGRTSIDSRGNRRVGRMSIELAAVMDRDELASQLEDNQIEDELDREQFRNAPGFDDDDMDGSASNRVSLSPDDHRMSKDSRSSQRGLPSPFAGKNGDVAIDMEKDDAGKVASDDKAKKGRKSRRRNTVINATILKNFEAQQLAQQRTPNNYPKIVTTLIPRLGRVASPVEKLFWFGSHKFFLWCVEFVLFFSTVLLSAAAAGMALTGTTDTKIGAVQIVGLVISALNLLFVAWRIAVILRRYIFILHNASLIPEVVALEAIHTVRSKRVAISDDVDDLSSVSESESEYGESSTDRRKRLGRFLRSQAESGKMPGIAPKVEGTEETTTESKRSIFRSKKRAEAASRREKRINAPFSQQSENTAAASSDDVVVDVEQG